MISITIGRNRQGQIKSFTVSGHAGYADHGQDIVCSAASALVQTAIYGLKQVADVPISYDISQGNARCVIANNLTEEQQRSARLLCDTMLLGLQAIADQFSDYLRIIDQGGGSRCSD